MYRCSHRTLTPNALLADVHARMPVILKRHDYDLWLDPGFAHVDALQELLGPLDANLMTRYPVSTRVNSPKNDDPQCAAALQTGQSLLRFRDFVSSVMARFVFGQTDVGCCSYSS